MIDWSDPSRVDEIHAYMIEPNNLDIVRGELTGIELDSSSLTYGYYTDTRVSGKIKVFESNYIENSWIRIIHKVPGKDYMKELGTFIVSKPSGTYQNGSVTTEYELQSVLWSMVNDLVIGHFTIGAGAYALDVFDRICSVRNREYIHAANAQNYRFSDTKIYEAFDSYLSDLYDVCNLSGNRLDVDGHGRITIDKYVVPSEISPTWTLDTSDPKSMIIDDPIDMDSNESEAAGRSIVAYSGNDTEIAAVASAPTTSPYSSGNRGYIRAVLHQVNDLSPATYERALSLAQQYIKTDMASTKEWKIKTLYFPCAVGETCEFILNGGKHTCLIKTIDPLELSTLTQTLTIKEV